MKNMAYNISRFAYLTVKKPLLELQGSGVGN
jgi:hypothetical protein